MKPFATPHIETATPCKDDVSVLSITQATAATFSDLFIRLTFLCFIRAGSKRVICPINGELTAREGDLLVFPPGSLVTLENRPLLDAHYRAEGVYFSHDLINSVFTDQRHSDSPPGIQVIRALANAPDILERIQDTLNDSSLPPPIRRHRLREPLIWLQHQGIRLSARTDEQPSSKLRSLIESDPSRDWRVSDVARSFAMSEATFRRSLARSGLGFSRVLQNTRLEKGLALLQATDTPISQIALECGFKTPSHFSDSFKKRFGIKPKAIRSAGD
ncbi:HTH-type transcriptional activator RhaS [Rhizobium rhizogenes]|uniref:HTH-type transcriptional activator RhaS n=2 Tax=Rhizobium rhizogenes TaxID=359 RepID=A0AAN2A1Y5_RHIRH|nr:HTH-type transcriptional activator RhaS [Rhizobium rhizogenes]